MRTKRLGRAVVAIATGVGIAAATIGFWLAVAAAGAAGASWRLRPSCLAPLLGERVVSDRRRRGYVPAVDEARPYRAFFPLGAPDRD